VRARPRRRTRHADHFRRGFNVAALSHPPRPGRQRRRLPRPLCDEQPDLFLAIAEDQARAWRGRPCTSCSTRTSAPARVDPPATSDASPNRESYWEMTERHLPNEPERPRIANFLRSPPPRENPPVSRRFVPANAGDRTTRNSGVRRGARPRRRERRRKRAPRSARAGRRDPGVPTRRTISLGLRPAGLAEHPPRPNARLLATASREARVGRLTGGPATVRAM
jgi:hypothetical protein